MSLFIEDLVRLHVVGTSLDDGYRVMVADKAQEAEAIEWCNALCRKHGRCSAVKCGELNLSLFLAAQSARRTRL